MNNNDTREKLNYILGWLGTHGAWIEHYYHLLQDVDRRLCRLERPRRKKKPFLARVDLINIAIQVLFGAAGFLLAASGKISWAEWFTTMSKLFI